MALAYFALGDDPEGDANRYLTDYYAFLARKRRNYIAGSAAKDAETVKGTSAAFEAPGCDGADSSSRARAIRPRSTCWRTPRGSDGGGAASSAEWGTVATSSRSSLRGPGRARRCGGATVLLAGVG